MSCWDRYNENIYMDLWEAGKIKHNPSFKVPEPKDDDACPVCGSAFLEDDNFWRVNGRKICADEFCLMRYVETL